MIKCVRVDDETSVKILQGVSITTNLYPALNPTTNEKLHTRRIFYNQHTILVRVFKYTTILLKHPVHRDSHSHPVSL